MNKTKTLKILIFLNIVLTALIYGGIRLKFSGNASMENSYIFGAALSLVNFILLTVLWKFVFSKKNIALMFIGIVSKYASLAGFILYAFNTPWLDKPMFIIGVLTNPLSILIIGIFYGLIPKK